MDELVLKAESREVIGKQVRALRRAGKLPGVLYGKYMKPTPILLDLHDATIILRRVASSSLVKVELGNETHLTLVRERQRDYIRGTLRHIDFQVVSMKEKLRVKVAIQITGDSPAVKDFNGVLVAGLSELEVECLPQDLPAKIVVDISGLKQIGSALRVSDIVLSDKITKLGNPDDMVVIVTGQAAEEVVPVAAEAFEPEVLEKGKKEEGEEEAE